MQLKRTPEVCCILQVLKGTFQRPDLSLAELQVQSRTVLQQLTVLHI